MTDRYAKYQRLRFDRPHPKVLRVTMDNGKMNTADAIMHQELVQIWRDIDADPTINLLSAPCAASPLALGWYVAFWRMSRSRHKIAGL